MKKKFFSRKFPFKYWMTTSRVMAEELAEIVADMVAEELEEKLAEDLAERWRKSWRIAPPTERVTNPGFCLLKNKQLGKNF